MFKCTDSYSFQNGYFSHKGRQCYHKTATTYIQLIHWVASSSYLKYEFLKGKFDFLDIQDFLLKV